MMRPAPDLAAAACSPPDPAAARQRGVAAETRWLARPDVAALRAALMVLGDARPADPAAFAASLAPWLQRDDWWRAFLTEGCAALCDEPMAAFPFRSLHGPAVHGLTLLATDRADVLLGVVDALGLRDARDRAALFSASLSVIQIVRAGGLQLVTHRLEQSPGVPPRLRSSATRPVEDGELLCIDNRQEAVTMVSADRDALVLRFTVLLPDRVPQRAFELATGQLGATAMVDDRASRMLPLLSLARLLGQAPRAAPMLAHVAMHPEPALRWAAMREWLVADPAAAVSALGQMAEDDADQAVRKAARTTLAIVAGQEAPPCPG